jgi:hypothetical protein
MALAVWQNRRCSAGGKGRLAEWRIANGQTRYKKNRATADLQPDSAVAWRWYKFLASWAGDRGAAETSVNQNLLSAICATETDALASWPWGGSDSVATRTLTTGWPGCLAWVRDGRVHVASVLFFQVKNQGQNSRQSRLSQVYPAETERLACPGAGSDN